MENKFESTAKLWFNDLVKKYSIKTVTDVLENIWENAEDASNNYSEAQDIYDNMLDYLKYNVDEMEERVKEYIG